VEHGELIANPTEEWRIALLGTADQTNDDQVEEERGACKHAPG
jgi:hypothetical protein